MHWIYVEPDVRSSWALWRFYSVILWWQHLFFLHNFLLVCCVIICWPWTFSTAAVDRREKPVSFKLNHSHRCWCLFLTFIVLLIYSSHLINWKGCSKTSFLNMSLMGPKSHLRWAIFSSFGRFHLLTLSQGHREVCHFQGRDTFFGGISFVGCTAWFRSRARWLLSFMCGVYYKYFVLEITTTISASWYFVLFDFSFAVEFPTL